MTSSVTLTARGLNTQPNQLSTEDGSLSVASNVIIRRDNVIEPRRGFKLWAEPMGSNSDRAKQLLEYKDRIIRHFASSLQFQNGTNNDGTANFDTFSGNYSEVQSGLRIKGIEANSNFYFTTAEGIKKISAATAEDLSSDSGYIVNSGAPKGLDITPILDITLGSSSGFLPQDSSAAYRVVWGYRDNNENLILGAPSGRAEIYNPMLTLMINDFNRILTGLDELGYDPLLLIDEENYFSTLGLNASSTAQQLRTNTIDLATKIDLDMIYADYSVDSIARATNVVTITFANGDISSVLGFGNFITLAGFDSIAGTSPNGTFQVQSSTTTTVTFNQVGADGSGSVFGTIVNEATNAPIVSRFSVVVADSPSTDLVEIEFSSALSVNNYFFIGQRISLQGFGDITVPINGTRTITGLGTNSIIFSVTGATGSTTTFGTITNHEYRSITEPVTMSSLVTHEQLESLQEYTNEILDLLKAEGPEVMNPTLKARYITPIDLTTSANVKLLITIPEEVTTNYFYQVYRSEVRQAVGTDVLALLGPPSDELQQVFEGFVTQAEINAGIVEFVDITPDAFLGANLYTNANSGEGILQSNEQPPLSTDLSLFKGYTFFSNTKTRHKLGLDLLGVTNVHGGQLGFIGSGNPAVIQVPNYDIATGDTIMIQGTNSDSVNGLHRVTNFSYVIDTVSSNTNDFVISFDGGDPSFNEFMQVGDSFQLSGFGNLNGNSIDGTFICTELLSNVIRLAFTGIGVGSTTQFGTIYNVTRDIDVTGTFTTLPVSGSGAGNTGIWSVSNLTITNDQANTNIYSFVEATIAAYTFETPDFSDIQESEYFEINSSNNERQYYFWFNKGSGVDPALTDKIGVEVNLVGVSAAVRVSERLEQAFASYTYDFSILRTNSTTLAIGNVTAGYTDPVTFSNGSTNIVFNVVQTGIGEQLQKQTQTITCVADVGGSLGGKGFLLNSAFNNKAYYVWFRVSGSGSNPAVSGRTGILVDLVTDDSAATVAEKIAIALDAELSEDFNLSFGGDDVIIENDGFGEADFIKDIPSFSPGFSYNVDLLGILTVEKSAEVSPSIATDETARSLISAINKNKKEILYAYYLSGVEDVAGKMLFESRSLSVAETPFYVLAGDQTFGAVFNPDIASEVGIASIGTGLNPTITSASHGFSNGQKIVITGSNSVPSIDGVRTVSNVTTNTFTINGEVATAGTTGYAILQKNAVFSDNEARANRVYFSKFQQPEAVPLLNFIDIGAKDAEILRIFPLRDSLFAFKKDGIYRISGEVAPFTVSLFDGSATLVAPDSVAVIENTIYCWERSGIAQVTESGVTLISRPIDNIIQPLSSNVYPGFRTSTFGVAYDSDQSYTVWTVNAKTDTVATIAYRYSTLTGTWTTYDKTNTCGIVNTADDLMYLGAGDTNYIEQERKDFDRTDYADREVAATISTGTYNSDAKTVVMGLIDDISVGDVFLQEQLLTVYEYNMMLQKLDYDTGPGDNNYFETLEAFPGDDLRTKIVELADKLDLDPNIVGTDYAATIATQSGTVSNVTGITESDPVQITSASHGLISGRVVTIANSNSTPSMNGNHVVTVIDANTFTIPVAVTEVGTSGNFDWQTNDINFVDIAACYNAIAVKLNADAGPTFSNYQEVDTTTIQEAIIVDINRITKIITLNLGLDFVQGPCTIFNAIHTAFQYTPSTMGDPLGWKHLREATVMFENRAFTAATLSFATDLLPQLIPQPFDSDGNGSFGNTNFGEGFFGGASNAMPFRTYVPRQCQRCRYMVLKYEHSVAREKYSVFGITLTGNISQSERAYRK